MLVAQKGSCLSSLKTCDNYEWAHIYTMKTNTWIYTVHNYCLQNMRANMIENMLWSVTEIRASHSGEESQFYWLNLQVLAFESLVTKTKGRIVSSVCVRTVGRLKKNEPSWIFGVNKVCVAVVVLENMISPRCCSWEKICCCLQQILGCPAQHTQRIDKNVYDHSDKKCHTKNYGNLQ